MADADNEEKMYLVELNPTIAQAVARGWCSEENKDKVFDPDLAREISYQVIKALIKNGK